MELQIPAPTPPYGGEVSTSEVKASISKEHKQSRVKIL